VYQQFYILKVNKEYKKTGKHIKLWYKKFII